MKNFPHSPLAQIKPALEEAFSHRLSNFLCRAAIITVAFSFAASALGNSVTSWGRQVLPPPAEIRNLLDVSAGDGFNLGLKPDGTVVAWGANNFHQSTIPQSLGEVTALAAGGTHAMALVRDGTVMAWGDNREQQAHPPNGLAGVVAICAGREHSLALQKDGSVSAWGSNRHGQTDVPEDLVDVMAISAGEYHNLALKTDGTVVAWGVDADGQASPPEDLTDVIAIAAGGSHSMALKKDGAIVAWGDNAFGQASFPGEIAGVIRIQAGRDHNLIMLEDGRVIAWGRNHYGQTSLPNEIPQARRIAAGSNHNVTLLEDGNIYAWGHNDNGQALNPRDLTSVVSISTWDNHTVALKQNGSVISWGTGMGTNSDPDKERLRDAVAVAAGRAHGLALRSNGTVVGWGDNLYGQASPPEDLRNVVAIAAGEFHSLALRNDGTIAAWGNNFQQQTRVPGGLSKVIAIAAGQEHSMALREGGLVFVWGNGFYGQKAVPENLASVESLSGGSFHSLAVSNDGTITAWGSNLFGQSSVPPGLSGIVAAAGGRSHSIAIRDNRTLVGWGGNHYGQATAPQGLGRVSEVAAGSGRTVALSGNIQPPRFARRIESRIVPAGEDVFLMPLVEGTMPLKYQWMKNGRPIEQANGRALSLRRVNAEDSGSYSLIIANSAGQATSDAFSIEVQDPAVAVSVNPRIAVLEEPASFTARVRGSGPFDFQWMKDGEPIPDAISEVFSIDSIGEEHTGTYSIEVSNRFSTVTSDPIHFLLEPAIKVQPQRVATARVGERLTLEIDAVGSRPLSVQWLHDGAPIRGANGERLVLENVGVAHEGVYTAAVSNPAGQVFSEETVLEIIPHIVFQPESQVFSSFKGTAVFEVRAIGTPPLTYHWMKNGRLLARSSEPRLTLEEIQADDAGEYYVIVINDAGRSESDRVRLVVPPYIAGHPRSTVVRAGEPVEFGVSAEGSQPMRFQWLKDGEPIEGAEKPNLRLKNVRGEYSGRYSVSVTNEIGSVTSEPGILAVSPTITTGPEDKSAPTGGRLVLTAEADGTHPLHYQWTKDGALITEGRDPSLVIENIQKEDAGYYSVIVSNAAGIMISDHVRIDVE